MSSNDWHRLPLRLAIWGFIKRQKNIAIFAPRRLGKTYLMQNYLLEEAGDYDCTAVFCDLQGQNSCEGAVLEIIKEIQSLHSVADTVKSRLKAKIAELIEGGEVKSVAEAISASNWNSLLDIVLESLNDSDQHYVIMLDEVTVCLSHILIENEAEGRQFFNILRKVRFKFPKVQWIFTGSIGIDALVDRYDMDGAINDLEPVGMQPLEQPEAIAFAKHIAAGSVTPFTFTDDAVELLISRLGWLSPFYIERLCDLIVPTAQETEGSPIAGPEDILSACEKILKYPSNRAFKSWTDHIDRNIPPEDQGALRSILDFLCDSETGERIDAVRHHLGESVSKKELRQAINRLESDGYICCENDRYRFVLPLLARYWEKYER